MTPETRSDVVAMISYLSSFESILMASLWLKIVTAINFRNLLLQAREVTLDVEVANIHDLSGDLKLLRSKWGDICLRANLSLRALELNSPCVWQRQNANEDDNF